MKKVICPECGKIIDADPEKPNVFCSKCGATFTFSQGKELIDKKYSQLSKYAYKLTYNSTDHEAGYNTYKSCLELRPNDLSSIIGMALNKIYGQSFDNICFLDVIELINSYDIALDKENTFLFLNFISDMENQIRYFFSILEKRLMIDGTFLKKEYFDYYVKGVQDSISLMKFLDSSFELLDEEVFDEFKKDKHDFLSNFYENLKALEQRKNNLYNVNLIGDVQFDGTETKNNVKTIDFEEPETLVVIVPDEKFLKMRGIFFVIFGILLIVALVLFITGAITKNNIIMWCGLIPVALLAVAYFIFYKMTK
ncbi:MAG: hypothetical protein H6689_00625 [Erysipelotrichaceae bacterium]|nr:hypothetical protein [Erysipelotrichaceae bacterium]